MRDDERVLQPPRRLSPSKKSNPPRAPNPASRSLSARLYDAQGVDDVQTLLGHTDAAMTELYKDDRGLDRRAGKWREVAV